LIEGYRVANYSSSTLNPIVASEIDSFLVKYAKYKERLGSCKTIQAFHQRHAHGDFQVGVLDYGESGDNIIIALNVLDDEEMATIDKECKKYGYTIDYEKIRQEVIAELEKASPDKKGNGYQSTR